ncbi:hypothetical protein ABT369_38685 [Dactylosporangium sp. NPDC000244]|uniref:hypothetical protein n=1 Tax=Dactylosporangium sp. NPDC000244 TaxID=3154365 RepID=UPI0033180B55
MIAVLCRVLRLLGEFFDLVEPEPTRLNCGCPDVAQRYLCGCGRTVCEQHRSDPHDCAEEPADVR